MSPPSRIDSIPFLITIVLIVYHHRLQVMHPHLFSSETSLYIALHNFPLTAQHIKGFLVYYIIHNLLALVSLTNPLIFLNTFKASLSS
ncbi:hypothetical protein BACI_c04060 [Bacillus cereus biovar anthracis str. CI]|nr:hypothetical protein BACI_c04060 [Bacillus cereus biovar anthracis str. CI]